jgi:IclR family acetate operon transcriptional repressor
MVQAARRTTRPATEGTEHALQPRSTDRGLSLLRVVADRIDGITLSDAARTVDLSPSTALRHLRSLESAGFVTRRADDGRFEPGPELYRIARALASGASLPRLAEPLLAELAGATGESTYLAEPLDRTHAVYTSLAEGHHAVRHVSWLGHQVSRRNTAVGAALADRVDDDGVAVRVDAVERGITAVSAPVRDQDGAPIAAISVVGPTYRLHGALLDRARSAVAAAAARLHAGASATASASSHAGRHPAV